MLMLALRSPSPDRAEATLLTSRYSAAHSAILGARPLTSGVSGGQAPRAPLPSPLPSSSVQSSLGFDICARAQIESGVYHGGDVESGWAVHFESLSKSQPNQPKKLFNYFEGCLKKFYFEGWTQILYQSSPSPRKNAAKPHARASRRSIAM